MPGSRAALALAAKQGFTARYGISCHHAVLEWLVAAGYVDGSLDVQRLGLDQPGIQAPRIFEQVLVSATDAQAYQVDDANRLRQGQIIGFWRDGSLMHSAVILELGGLMAGANNAGVFDPHQAALPRIHQNLFAIFFARQMDWRAGGKIGQEMYTLHHCSPRVVMNRIAAYTG